MLVGLISCIFQFNDGRKGAPIYDLMSACGGVLKMWAGAEALLLPSLPGERGEVAKYLQWASDRGCLSFRIVFERSMPQFLVEGLAWTDCPSLSQLPWELPIPGMSLRYASGFVSLNLYMTTYL